MASAAGLKPFETDSLPLEDVWIAIAGHNENIKLQWEVARAISFNIHAHSMIQKKKRSPEQFWPLPWDRKRAGIKRISAQEFMEMFPERKKLGQINQNVG